ncbi:uncharacterized protein LOC117607218 [Osmia lignaria lignaria]|uniref:uncharacterized protein LOC117607218 n=1 Tax=Osmia lignaria lignaria TaxID=1437193 RepID=UPI0014791751|nr:uncharacterized protein LOC117607218 [Osmia lignaria]XP_034186536.1 uncharacterized protein LOC117607218 [Osmia lignaria]XP_034186537.1 uncharacterized protein LOC117607218 [Osmia lignaria]XP_034186538.1 uncharacterized protein LOC117607218 [Osmia lignaria]
MFDSNKITELDDDDFQAQKNKDREIRAGRSKCGNKYSYTKTKKSWKKRLIKCIINDLKNYGPTNVMHIKALANITGKPIRIFTSDGNLYQTINCNRNDRKMIQCDAIDIEYHKEKHWTLLGNKDPAEIEKDLNACLFVVIAAQTGKNSTDLRNSTIDYLTNNANYLIEEIDKISSDDNALLMIGGARYNGTSPRAAGIILDDSQNVLCDGCREVGHPRGHASDKDATGPIDSVENYSRTTGSRKSGFLSRNDQNLVAHYALCHESAQQAMNSLNNGEFSLAITLLGKELPTALPKMKEFVNGEAFTGELSIIRVTVVLRHHQGKRNDPDANVFVHTIYPRSS